MKVAEIIRYLQSRNVKMEVWNPIKGSTNINMVSIDPITEILYVNGADWVLEFDQYGHYIINNNDGDLDTSDECMLFPSREEHDWDTYAPIKVGDYVTRQGVTYFITELSTSTLGTLDVEGKITPIDSISQFSVTSDVTVKNQFLYDLMLNCAGKALINAINDIKNSIRTVESCPEPVIRSDNSTFQVQFLGKSAENSNTDDIFIHVMRCKLSNLNRGYSFWTVETFSN